MTYNVYVIELDKGVLSSKRFRVKNPNMNSKKACYYVGQTSHDPHIRFEQHKKGYKSNQFARKYGIRLEPRIFSKFNPIPNRKEAERIEQWITEKLREKGHGVWSN
ncbi:MAG: GIY-YIG nuclease family protein [Thermoplasmatota archaeon]